MLEDFLKSYNLNIHQLSIRSGIPESTFRYLNKRELGRWNIEYIEAIANVLEKDKHIVIDELSQLMKKKSTQTVLGKYDIENRRYIGSKNKLLAWLSELMDQYTKGVSFFDVFAGTGVVSVKMLPRYDKIIMNDFLYSNNIIYNAFLGTKPYDATKLITVKEEFNSITKRIQDDSYFEDNFGGRFFSNRDAMVIGEIRTRIENNHGLSERERDILIASLIYSSDKIANTVGHYDAYRKKVNIPDRFCFDLINPINVAGKEIVIYREDANKLVRKVEADISFIDPPYNSRQYSRFYHVLEGIAKWDKPKLEGVAMKPPVENMSNYCKNSAPATFDDLITHLNTKYIVVTYNNTYDSKSHSSQNKITHDEIISSLNKVGKTRIFESPFQFFNAGKTDLQNHKEFVFITEVKSTTHGASAGGSRL